MQLMANVTTILPGPKCHDWASACTVLPWCTPWPSLSSNHKNTMAQLDFSKLLLHFLVVCNNIGTQNGLSIQHIEATSFVNGKVDMLVEQVLI
jgi:hypothetical protein